MKAKQASFYSAPRISLKAGTFFTLIIVLTAERVNRDVCLHLPGGAQGHFEEVVRPESLESPESPERRSSQILRGTSPICGRHSEN